jgi:hypothetical protein
MASSDGHAAKCVKLSLNYSESYPEELEAYKAARDEYNVNETMLAQLQAELEAATDDITEDQID